MAAHDSTTSQEKTPVDAQGIVANPTFDSDINIRAAERMGLLHDAVRSSNHSSQELDVILVRLLFCLFADNSGIFRPQGVFRRWIEEETAEDGSDLGQRIVELSEVLGTPECDRVPPFDQRLACFPFVGGRLFEERVSAVGFEAGVRSALLDCCGLDWGIVSPGVLGGLLQSAMDANSRRSLGVHYTSEENILKVIKPLFLDELAAEFVRVRGNKSKLFEFHRKVRRMTLLDPACGCGNFLVTAYRELRVLELEILEVVRNCFGLRLLSIYADSGVDVDQCYGIEIEEFPARVASFALGWVDHQMSRRAMRAFGPLLARIPFTTQPSVVHGNALELDWNEVLPVEQATYVFGNPPFVGKQMRDARQIDEIAKVFHGVERAGVLDYCAAWFAKAALYLLGESGVASTGERSLALGGSEQPRQTRCAFVATSSITQGEQVSVLWGWLLSLGIRIHFAHRTFAWSTQMTKKAAVHCVIVGFGLLESEQKWLFEYDNNRVDPRAMQASNISPYLLNGPSIVLSHQPVPLCNVPPMQKGSMPIDQGHFLFSDDEKATFLAAEPKAERWFRPFCGADEFINAVPRWCLWLVGISNEELGSMPEVNRRVLAVQQMRACSRREQTRRCAATPHRFGEDRQPLSQYLLVPSVSSERREWVPVGFQPPNVIASNLVLTVPNASVFHFSILSSTMHNAWLRVVCGRLRIDYRYSASIVYNNYPWPYATERQRRAIEQTGQRILDVRASHRGANLAELYDKESMPGDLREAHVANDRAVDAAYGYSSQNSDTGRVGFLFALYCEIRGQVNSGETESSTTRLPLGKSSGQQPSANGLSRRRRG